MVDHSTSLTGTDINVENNFISITAPYQCALPIHCSSALYFYTNIFSGVKAVGKN